MLQNDLAKVDRSKTPWLITILHAPWYNTNHAHQGNGDAMKADMEEVLYNANVDLVVGGHVHAYERSVSSIMFLPSSPLTLLLICLWLKLVLRLSKNENNIWCMKRCTGYILVTI